MVIEPPPGSQSEPDPATLRLVGELAAHRRELALLLDFDGTLAPIVDDPAAARPDPLAAAALRELDGRLALAACITGRPAQLARDLLGVDSIAYSGLHGAERLAAGAREAETPEAFAADGRRIAELIDAAAAEPDGLAGLDVERKGPIVALHWRRAPDPASAEARARQLAARAETAGLRTGEGRSVLELRPALEITKGDAARALLQAAGSPRRVLFAGDDITDLDAFAELRQLRAAGELDEVTLIAVSGDGAPPQVAAAADLTLSSPEQLGGLLSALAAAIDARDDRAGS